MPHRVRHRSSSPDDADLADALRAEEGVLILAGLARFLAAHTPTRRELSRVVDIATRLRRGEDLFEAE